MDHKKFWPSNFGECHALLKVPEAFRAHPTEDTDGRNCPCWAATKEHILKYPEEGIDGTN